YNLEFHASLISDEWQITLADNPQTKLILGQRANLLPGFKAGLLLEHKNVYGKNEFRAVIPTQRFVVPLPNIQQKLTSPDQIYFEHLFDKMNFMKDYLYDDLTGNAPHDFQYTGMENLCHFDVKLIGSGTSITESTAKINLEGKSTADNLYLAYAYM